jgi:hypothetical protein
MYMPNRPMFIGYTRISMDIPCISNGVDIRDIYMDIRVYPSCIYHVYPWIYMVYHLMYIHGIYVVYPWIFLGRSVLLVSFNAHTSLCNQSVSFHAPPWQLCQGIKRPTKGSLLLSPRRRSLALRGAAGRLRGGAAGWVAS